MRNESSKSNIMKKYSGGMNRLLNSYMRNKCIFLNSTDFKFSYGIYQQLALLIFLKCCNIQGRRPQKYKMMFQIYAQFAVII